MARRPHARAGRKPSPAVAAAAAEVQVPPAEVLEGSLLAQLAEMTVLSIDSGDLNVVRSYAATGLITDATTNPLFVSQAGLKGEGEYQDFVDDAVAYAKSQNQDTPEDACDTAMDKLSVNLGLALMEVIPGNVSTEVDIRLSFDTDASVARARRIIQLVRNSPPNRPCGGAGGGVAGAAAAAIAARGGGGGAAGAEGRGEADRLVRLRD